MIDTKVKICGITQKQDVLGAAERGVDFIGFVLEKASSRYVSIDRLKELLSVTPPSIKSVALVVNPLDSFIEKLLTEVKIDYLQLHGQEIPKRVKQIYKNSRVPIIKAIGIKRKKDLDIVKNYEEIVSHILLDAKPDNKQLLPGGNGISFDWNILKEFSLQVPWFLAGGLDEYNIKKAISLTSAPMVDVSSGVEAKPGKKSMKKITEFLRKVNEFK